MGLSAGQVEAVQVAGRTLPTGVHAVDACHPRSLSDPALERLEVLSRALGDQLDGAVGVVADPSPQPKLLRLAERELAETHALHVTTRHRLQSPHAHLL